MNAPSNKPLYTALKTAANITPPTVDPPVAETQKKEEVLRWTFAITSAVIIYLLLAAIVLNIYHPDVQALHKLADSILFEGGSAMPEPMEALLFRLGVLTLVPAAIAFYAFSLKSPLFKRIATSYGFHVISIVVIFILVLLIYFDFAAGNPFSQELGGQVHSHRDKTGKSNFDFYFDGFLMGTYTGLYLLVLLPLIFCLFYLGQKKYNWDGSRIYKVSTSALVYLLVVSCVISVAAMNTFEYPYNNDNKLDFNAVYFSMTQVYAGLPMLVDHFTNTYGLYPHFLNPLFCIIGMNILKFSFVMSLLIGMSFLMNFYFLKSFIHNKIILALCFASVVFFPYLQFKLSSPFDSIFSFYPIRYIIPSTLAFLTTLYLNNKSQRLYYIIYITMAFFILWNPEMGMVGYLSWTLLNVYKDFYAPNGAVNTKVVLKHLLVAACTVVIVFYTYKLLIYVFYGAWPDLSLLFETIFVFGKVGFGLLPMAVIHPWNLMALVLLISFTYAGTKWYKKSITKRSCVVFLASLIALGYFIYFQGRSHNYNFSLSSGFCFMLLGILGDELWNSIKTSKIYLLHALFVIFMGIISFSFFELVYKAPEIADLFYQQDDKDKDANNRQILNDNKVFLTSHTRPHERIVLLASKRHEDLYLNDTKLKSAIIPGLEDMFLNTDLHRIENMLRDSSLPIFIEPAFSNYPFLAKAIGNIAATYEFKEGNRNFALLQKRTIKTPGQTFFRDTSNFVLHRKYTDDTAGVAMRATDALGIKTINMDSSFAVELLFNSQPQIYPGATLVGNSPDSTGFVIGNLFGTPKSMFIFNKFGVAVTIPYGEWAYCVVNVYPGHIDLYQNGIMTHSGKLPGVFRNSPNMLFVGNIGSPHYYVGAIAEVAIATKPIDSMQIKQTWGEISHIISK